MTSKLLFSITIEAIIVAIGGVVVGESDVVRAVFIMRAIIGRVFGLVTLTKAALILLTVFANVSWMAAFVAYNARSFRREVGSRDEMCAYVGKLMVPTGIVDSRSVLRTDGDFDPGGRFGRYDDWTMWVAWVNGEVTGVRSFSLFLLLSLLLVFMSRFPKECGCFLFDSLEFQVVEHTFLLSDDATEGEGKVSDSLSDVVLGRLKLYLGGL